MTQMTQPSADFPTEGSQMCWTAPSGTSVIVQRDRFTYIVTTMVGPRRDPERSAAFATEREARACARAIARTELARWHQADVEPADSTATVAEESLVAPTVVVQAPRYGKTQMSPSAVELITYVMAHADGEIRRGRGLASDATLRALARRGFAELKIVVDNGRKIIVGATVTGFGALRARELA